MTSKLKVNVIADGGDNAIMTSNGSGTLTLNNAALKNTPAFEAVSSGNQSVSDATVTKITLDTETFDSNGCYDHSTNYRFTPNVAGKYFVYTQAFFEEASNFNRLFNPNLRIRKNGSDIANGQLSQISNNGTYSTSQPITFNCTVDMNGSSDYLESFAYVDVSSGTPTVKNPRFGAYRIIGA